MSNNHITYFKVENFKKFDSLEVKDIGQFNLIVGDNNVGKTCLLEALLVDENDIITNNNFGLSLVERSIIKFDKYDESTSSINSKKQHLKKEVHAQLILNDKEFPTDRNSNIKYNPLFPLITFGKSDSRTLFDLYNLLQTKKDKLYLINVLRVVFPKLDNVEYKAEFKEIKDTYIFEFQDEDDFIPLNYLGDGFKRIFFITLKALALRGKRILIDEIEIGIHYSRQKEFLINLFKICTELEIQLFATTHSKECIFAYKEALEELKLEEKGKFIKLKEKKDKGIKAITYPFEEFKYLVESETETR
jgi:AAA15 family ATPase/GTPase